MKSRRKFLLAHQILNFLAERGLPFAIGESHRPVTEFHTWRRHQRFARPGSIANFFQFIAAVVWSIILAFCAVGFVYLFSDTLAQYLRFEKIVQLNVSLISISQTLLPVTMLAKRNA
ncbi:hypothetical protein GCK32_021789 [Trichostrongylus colubriformis]|uniref:Uncharacterized protein n=1 Tax=Trichostrongylus colubriformis TaxID=6319 RepID=A0AAN8FJ54_TRICO